MAMPRLTAPIILMPLAVAVLFLDGLRRGKHRRLCRQKRVTCTAVASWENEGGRITSS